MEPNRGKDNAPEPYSVAYPNAADPRLVAVPRHWGRRTFGPAAHDRTAAGAPLDAPFVGTLLPYQERALAAVDRVLDREGGAVLEAGCGTGKTVMAIACMARRGVKAVVLCHKDFLVKQWVERLGQFLPGARVGVVQGKRCCDMGEVDVAVVMLQTVLARRWGGAESPFAEEVGLVVADEAHHMCAKSFAAALRAFPARLRLALTATPDRKDGLGYAIHYFFGPTACRVRRAYADVTVVRVDGAAAAEVPRNYKGDVDFSKAVARLAADEDRNARIVALVTAAVAAGRRVILFSALREHLAALRDACEDAGVAAGLYVGETTKAGRARRAEVAARCDVICASYPMGEEGLDIPPLSVAFLATPRSGHSALAQCVGRVLRACPGKPPPGVVDVVDAAPTFKNMWYARHRYYKQQRGFTLQRGAAAALTFFSRGPN